VNVVDTVMVVEIILVVVQFFWETSGARVGQAAGTEQKAAGQTEIRSLYLAL
jgi:hypothetical protein